MSEELSQIKANKPSMPEEEVEEVRLKPKQKENSPKNAAPTNVSKIAPKDDDFDFDKMNIQNSEQKIAPKKEVPKPKVEKPKKDQGFGGLAAGFLNSNPPKKAAKKAPEDVTHVKAKDKSE